jgi:uncharacterized protein YndB with AHSA1/START domain
MSQHGSEMGSEVKSATRSVVVEKEFAHSPQKVWRALTEGDLIRQWLMENDFQPVVGRAFQLRAEPVPGWDGVIDGEVLLAEPYERLSYSWGTMGLGTVVAWTLTPTERGTLVRMEQSGFGAEQEANYKGATYGWRKFFGGLERVVDEISEEGA